MNRNVRLLLMILAVLSSRLFFIDAGYGSEEDAWGYAVNAQQMKQTHLYAYSRLPGHPVVEYAYSWLPLQESWVFNICTVLLSTLAVVFFFLICERYKLNAFTGAVMLAFTPVFYIHSSDAMDYNWSLCFLLGSFYFLGRRWIFLSAFFLALAIGCRITAGIALIPFLLYLFLASEKKSNILQYAALTLIVTFIIFSPAIKRYGFSFFNYVNQFGYPPLIKTFYKASFGVWGTIGFLAITTAVIYAAKEFLNKSYNRSYNPLIYTSVVLTILFTLLYFYEPHKAGYLIPVVPFIILFILLFITDFTYQAVMCLMLVAGCFVAGINLADENRSATPSGFSIVMKIHHQKVAFDLLSGSVTDDYKKRWARINYTNKIIETVDALAGKKAVISGYWLNNILIQNQGKEDDRTLYVYYIDKREMTDLTQDGYKIYYIRGQDIFNDHCFKDEFTDKLAFPLELNNYR